jgi:hypothetical protein
MGTNGWEVGEMIVIFTIKVYTYKSDRGFFTFGGRMGGVWVGGGGRRGLSTEEGNDRKLTRTEF